MNALLFTLLLLSPASDPREPVDFDTQVAPILSKAGCNAAACHGSAEGRGGFKLSLFGGDPQADFDAIVRDREGRRLRYDTPRESILLSKPGGELDHEGGVRLDLEGDHARRIMRWIEEGATRRRTYRLRDVQVNPKHFVAETIPTQFPLRVTATFERSDGTTVDRDVTDLAVYESSDNAALSINAEGVVEVRRKGRSVLVVRFLSKVLTTRVTAPLSNRPIRVAEDARANWIDEYVLESLEQLRIPPSPQASDTQLLRRASLDLTGRLPTEAEARAFANDKDPDRYEKLLDRLLKSPAFNDYWCFRLMNLLRVGGVSRDQTANEVYANWLRSQIAEGRPIDELIADLLTSLGDSHQVGPANFYRAANGSRKQAEFVSEALMGVRLRCANCHNHPLDKWTQDDYHGLAALLVSIDAKQTVRVVKGRNVQNPRTGQNAVPRIPGSEYLDAEEDGRLALAAWLTSTDNPYFARAFVNRLWKSLMGRGLVEPVDDLRDTNPATHPLLLEELKKRFVAGDYKVRPLLRAIMMSAAYRRSSRAIAGNEADDRFYARALVKPLEAEVQMDAIGDVTEVGETYELLPDETRAVQLFNPKTPSISLDILGRCDRQEDSCEAAPGEAVGGGLSTRLHLINGRLLNSKITNAKGSLHRAIQAGRSTEEIVASFYWRALSRAPRSNEIAFWTTTIGDDPKTRDARLEDFVWSLLSSSAFTKNH